MKRIRLLVASCCLAAFSVAAHAGERWRHLEPQEMRAVEPRDFLAGADGSVWLFDAGGVRRVDANGVTTGWLQAPTGSGGYDQAQLTSDHGAIFAQSPTGACRLVRVDAAVRVRWTREMSDACTLTAGNDGSAWVTVGFSGTLVKLDADGNTAAQIGGARENMKIATTPDGGVVASSSGGTLDRATLARFDGNGAARWSIERSGLFVAALAVSSDGTTTVAGIRDGLLVVFRLGANGVAVGSEYTAPPGGSEGDVEIALAPDGSALVSSRDYSPGTSTRNLYRFRADGSLAWRTGACVNAWSYYMPPDAVALLADGSTAAACPADDGGRLMRYDAGGGLVANTRLPTQGTKLAQRADGTLQALGNLPGGAEQRLYVIDANGNPADAPKPLAAEPLEPADQFFADDGSSYVLSRSGLLAAPRRLALSKIDANGVVVWRRAIDAVAPRARLSVAGGQACVAQARENASPWPTGFPEPPPPPGPAPVAIACVASADGGDRWTRSYPADAAEHFFGALDDGTFVHVRSLGSTHEIVRHDAAGNEVSHRTLPDHALSGAIDAAGNVAVGTRNNDVRRIVRYDAAGVAHTSDIGSPYGFEVIGVSATSVQAYVGDIEDGRGYRWFDADGRLAWAFSTIGIATVPLVDRAAGAVYVVENLGESGPWSRAVRVVRRRAGDGAVEWRSAPVDVRADDPFHYRFALGASAGQVVVAHAVPGRLHVARIDATSGSAIGEETAACLTYCGYARGVAVDAAGNVRVVLPIAGATGVTSAVVALADAFRQAAVRIDQAGLTGAWWAPYADGEGFVVDWLPDARTWFMPWFTFSIEGGSGPAGQRWYAVAGQIAAGATQAELPILETTGGTFDAGGGVTSRQVGTARLRFTDCDNGTLRYTFDAGVNGGAVGTITLSRLSPATQDCVLADGSVQARTTTPANGFDARMSGSWFEEATSGQGLQFTVQPGGLFFAPWFTFDPASASPPDDAGRQRWYALQGSLANAVDGRATFVIAQALGGAFDRVPASDQFVVGSATLTMTGCDRATLDYRFDASEAAGDMGGRTGSIALTKIGGCAP